MVTVIASRKAGPEKPPTLISKIADVASGKLWSGYALPTFPACSQVDYFCAAQWPTFTPPLTLELVSFPNQRTSAPVNSRLALLGGTHPVAWSSSITVNNGLQAREAALGGAGVAILPKFLTVNDEYNGQLVELQSTEKSPEMEIHMLHPYTRDLPQRVREFMDFSIGYWREKGLVEE